MAGIGTPEVGSLRGTVKRKVVWIANLVRPVTEASGVAEIGGQDPGYRFAALCRGDSGHLPASQNALGNTFHVTQEFSAMPDGEFIEVAYGEAVPQVRRHRSVFEVGSIGILNKPSDVAVGIAQVLGKGVGSQEIKSIGKAFIQRCLKCVVEHLELREVQRQDRSQVGLLVKVPPAKVGDAIVGVRPAEIAIQYLQRLVQITGFVVPQVI